MFSVIAEANNAVGAYGEYIGTARVVAEGYGRTGEKRCQRVSVPSVTAYGSAIFFNEKVCALSFRARNKSVTEDNCSWVVNYNGNINNNNRNNSNDVRAVSEFQ